MKFAHLADCHLGSWQRKPELQELNIQAFEQAIDKSVSQGVSFILIAGDFFDVSFPTNTALLSRVFAKLRELNDRRIPLYVIPGSHDFSASGESIIHVCEAAGLCINLMNLLETAGNNVGLNFYKDNERNVLFTGVLGKRIGLEIDIIKSMNKQQIEDQLEDEKGLKIFLVHTAISELMPFEMKEHMETISLSDLPKGFNYYAAGHIHDPKIVKSGGITAAYSGCIFPNNFAELAGIKQGSYIIADFNEETKEVSLQEEKLALKEVISIVVDAKAKDAREVEEELLRKLDIDLKDKIVTVKVAGTLESGKVSDINFENIYKIIKGKECFSFLRNTHGLTSKEFEIEVSKAESVEEIEKEIINISLMQIDTDKRQEKGKLIASLMKLLDKERLEDETKDAFSSRIVSELAKSLDLGEKI